MKNKISLEYAEALFLLACEQKQEDAYLKDLSLVGEALNDKDFMLFLRSPNISFEEKEMFIDSTLGGALKEDTVSFIKLLCQKGRAELLPLCIEDFEKLYNQVKRVIVAQVTSAVPLTDEEKTKLTKSLEKKPGHTVELVCRVDKEIIGGIIIRTEDSVLDGSLKQKIRKVKEVIKSEPKT